MIQNNQRSKNIFTVIDIGSSKLICITAEINDDDIKIIGYSHKESRGFFGGVVSDIKQAKNSIINVIADNEDKSGVAIRDVTLIISPKNAIYSHYSKSIKIAKEEVSQSDINNLANMVRQDFKNNNRDVLHLIPLKYQIDNSTNIINPHYMSGEDLHCRYNVISVPEDNLINLESCLKNCQLSINNYLIEPLSSSFAVLSENEMNFGSIVIDMGSNFTSLGIVIDNKFSHFFNLAIGGSAITNDIAKTLNVDFITAEKIKNLNNSLIISPIEERELIRIGSYNPENLELSKTSKAKLHHIITTRIEEIIEILKDRCYQNKIPIDSVSNLVITGGCSNIIGIERIFSEIFQKNARIGYPNKIKNIDNELHNPIYSASIGSLLNFQLNKNKFYHNQEDMQHSLIKTIINKIIGE
jgi:cell division protein FtsA